MAFVLFRWKAWLPPGSPPSAEQTGSHHWKPSVWPAAAQQGTSLPHCATTRWDVLLHPYLAINPMGRRTWSSSGLGNLTKTTPLPESPSMYFYPQIKVTFRCRAFHVCPELSSQIDIAEAPLPPSRSDLWFITQSGCSSSASWLNSGVPSRLARLEHRRGCQEDEASGALPTSAKT